MFERARSIIKCHSVLILSERHTVRKYASFVQERELAGDSHIDTEIRGADTDELPCDVEHAAGHVASKYAELVVL